jgi:hypothetical protein
MHGQKKDSKYIRGSTETKKKTEKQIAVVLNILVKYN